MEMWGVEVFFFTSKGGGRTFFDLEEGLHSFHIHVLGFFSVYSETKLVLCVFFPLTDTCRCKTILPSYSPSMHHTFNYTVYNLIYIQKELNLCNVHKHANACM